MFKDTEDFKNVKTQSQIFYLMKDDVENIISGNVYFKNKTDELKISIGKGKVSLNNFLLEFNKFFNFAVQKDLDFKVELVLLNRKFISCKTNFDKIFDNFLKALENTGGLEEVSFNLICRNYLKDFNGEFEKFREIMDNNFMKYDKI